MSRVSGMIPARRTAWLLMAVYLAVAAFLVFWPSADIVTDSVLGIWALLHRIDAPSWIAPVDVEFVTNVLLFMPLGFLGSALKPRWGWRRWLGLGLAGTLLIESTQFFFLPGRSAQLADVVANTLGALAGYFLMLGAKRL